MLGSAGVDLVYPRVSALLCSADRVIGERRQSGVYLYALLGATPAAGPGVGVCDEPLRIVEIGGLLALVGDVPRRCRRARTTLTAQDAVLAGSRPAWTRSCPRAFGAPCWADDAALAEAWSPRRGELAQALAQVAGCEQMTLRVGEQAAPARRGRRSRARPRRPIPGVRAAGRVRCPGRGAASLPRRARPGRARRAPRSTAAAGHRPASRAPGAECAVPRRGRGRGAAPAPLGA